MHGVEPGEQPPDETGPLPHRQCAIELPEGGRGGVENIEDVFDGREMRSGGPEASPSLGVQFVNAEVQVG
jgi:hypothetical protein